MYMPICRNTVCSTHMLCSTYRNIYIACCTTCLWYHVLHRTRSPCAYIYISYPLIQTTSYMHMPAGIHCIIWFRGVCMCIYTHACAPLKPACIQLADSSIPRVHALTHRSKWTTCAPSWCCTQGTRGRIWTVFFPGPTSGSPWREPYIFSSLLGWGSCHF